MISRYEVYLNGVAMSSISPDILLVDIEYPAPNIENETYAVARRHGARIHHQYVGRQQVSVSFSILSYDTNTRQTICAEVAKWAKNGGILQTSDRIGQRLRCVCGTFPSISSAMRWTDVLRVVFVAYALPFWEEDSPAVLQLTGTNESETLYVPGNFDGAVVEASIEANAALTSVTLGVNGSTLSLTGLSISSGQIIKITYDDEMIQSIKVGAVSLLDKRTGVDDLLANCGEMNTFTVSANASVTVDFSVRGLWL